jgi:hypothetical protein
MSRADLLDPLDACMYVYVDFYISYMDIDNSRGYLGPRQNLHPRHPTLVCCDWNPHDRSNSSLDPASPQAPACTVDSAEQACDCSPITVPCGSYQRSILEVQNRMHKSDQVASRSSALGQSRQKLVTLDCTAERYTAWGARKLP